MTKILGLGHKARQGKDCFAAAMIEVAPDKIKRYAFADELKRYCAANHEELFAKYPEVPPLSKEDPIYGYVAMLQHVGSLEREKDPDVWLNKVKTGIETDKPEIAVITDLRYPNEANYVHSADGILVKLMRLDESGMPYIDPNRPPHSSEVALEDYPHWDLVIKVPSGMMDSLKEAAKLVAEGLLAA